MFNFHCAGCEFLYGFTIVLVGIFLQLPFLNSPLILIGAFITAFGTFPLFRGLLHINKRNKIIKTMTRTNIEDLR